MGGSGGGGGSYTGGAGGGSGGNGSGSGGGGGSEKPTHDPCDLRFEATISGPNTDYADMLTLGTILSVRLGGPHGRTFELITSQGYVVGSLIGLPQAGELLECIQHGNAYQAEVVQKVSGTISVLVSRSG